MICSKTGKFVELLKALKLENETGITDMCIKFPAHDHATITITKILTEEQLEGLTDFIKEEDLGMTQLGKTTYILESAEDDQQKAIVEKLNEALENS